MARWQDWATDAHLGPHYLQMALAALPVSTSLQVPRQRDLHKRTSLMRVLMVPKGGLAGNEPSCQCRRHRRLRFDPPVWKIPWGREWQPTPILLPREFHGQRSLVGYSPWDQYKELDMTEQLSTSKAGSPL